MKIKFKKSLKFGLMVQYSSVIPFWKPYSVSFNHQGGLKPLTTPQDKPLLSHLKFSSRGIECLLNLSFLCIECPTTRRSHVLTWDLQLSTATDAVVLSSVAAIFTHFSHDCIIMEHYINLPNLVTTVP